MNIAEIGDTFSLTKKVVYLSDRTFVEYDLLIIDFDYLLMGKNDWNKPEFDKRQDSLTEFLRFKNLPLIFLTPKHRRLTFLNSWYDLHNFVPIPPFSISSESGDRVQVVPNTLFTGFLKKYELHFNYQGYFDKHQGKVIAETPLTKKNIGFYNENSVFLPGLRKSIREQEKDFLQDLLNLVKRIKGADFDEQLPDWSNNYFIPSEREAKLQVESLKIEIELLSQELAERNQAISNLNKKKILFTGTGNNLETEIQNIFSQIGFEVLKPDGNRDDLIIKYNDQVAVVEIKGISGSAAEKHAAQLEKWVSDYFEKNEKQPKGILIVNAFKDLELRLRTEKSFPDQMLKFSKQREHCLITTLQLLGLYYEIINNPPKKEELINSLFETIGVYNGYDSWNKFISLQDTLKTSAAVGVPSEE